MLPTMVIPGCWELPGMLLAQLPVDEDRQGHAAIRRDLRQLLAPVAVSAIDVDAEDEHRGGAVREAHGTHVRQPCGSEGCFEQPHERIGHLGLIDAAHPLGDICVRREPAQGVTVGHQQPGQRHAGEQQPAAADAATQDQREAAGVHPILADPLLM